MNKDKIDIRVLEKLVKDLKIVKEDYKEATKQEGLPNFMAEMLAVLLRTAADTIECLEDQIDYINNYQEEE